MSATLTEAPPAENNGIETQLDYLNQYVSFRVEQQLFGVPVNAVQEVLNPQAIARTPKARSEIAGLLNLRGQIVTAVNLRKRLGLPALDSEKESMNVVVRQGAESFSLLVDEVGDVINVSGETLEPVPHTLDPQWKAVTHGVFRLEEQLFIILNTAAVLRF
jgi:purine-binding chemotaxis protein CheW